MFFLPHNARKRTIQKKKKFELKCPSIKLIERTGVFILCCIIMGTFETKSLLSKRKKFMCLCSQKRSIAGENTFQPLTCVSVSTEQAQDTLRRQQKELLQLLTKVALPRFMQKANLVSRPTGELLVVPTWLVAPRELGAGIHPCHSLLVLSLPLLPGGGWRSPQLKPLKSQHEPGLNHPQLQPPAPAPFSPISLTPLTLQQ